MANSLFAIEPAASPNLDLKWSLTLRVVAVAFVCFFIAAALALFGTYRDIRQNNENVADLVVKQLGVQLFRIESNIGVWAQFPDWDPVTERVQSAGQCIQYIKPDGSVGRSSCVTGFNYGNGVLQKLFFSLGTWLLADRAHSARPVSYRGKTYGTLIVTTETATILAAIWKDVSGLLALTALLVCAICLLQYVAIRRALRPTKDILAGLDRLARGDLSCRLPRFGLLELQRMSEVFNALAANLDRTTHERSALAARLVNAQEQERRHLARELHDEFAQSLSAMSAAAASIKATAETECPVLVAEANNLMRTSMGLMRSLRTTLQNLRPPEIDDFGLVATLTALAKDQERRAGGKLKILLDVDGDLGGMSPTAAAHIYRIVQESLTNIGKHANASRACIAFDFHPESGEGATCGRRWLALTIEDDGCGAAYHGKDPEGDGFGLIGIRERVMALGGQLEIIHEDRGFKLQVMIPFETLAGVLP